MTVRREMAEWRATSARSGWSLLFVWFVSFVWLNQTDQIDQMNQINPRVALFPPVSPVSLESGIGACSRNAHE